MKIIRHPFNEGTISSNQIYMKKNRLIIIEILHFK